MITYPWEQYLLLHVTTFLVPLCCRCGYNQKYSGSHSPPSTAGVLGLGNGKVNIVSQLRNIGITKNVLGHCLSGRGGGFLFFGDDLVPSGIVWTPISSNPTEYVSSKFYILSSHNNSSQNSSILIKQNKPNNLLNKCHNKLLSILVEELAYFVQCI